MPELLSKEDSFQAEGETTEILRRIRKSELALLYEITTDALRKRILKTEGLMDELHAIGYNKNMKDFKKQEAAIIYKYLGNPY